MWKVFSYICKNKGRILAAAVIAALFCALYPGARAKTVRAAILPLETETQSEAGEDSGADTESETQAAVSGSSLQFVLSDYCEKALEAECRYQGVEGAQQLLDECFALDPANGTYETFVMAMYRQDSLDGSLELDYSSYLESLSGACAAPEGMKAVQLQKAALVFLTLQAEDDVISYAYENTLDTKPIMSKIGAIRLLNAMQAQGIWPEGAEEKREELIADLCSRQLADGGFSYAGDEGDCDVTAMALQVLGPCQDREDARACIDRALIFLQEIRLPEGDFPNMGTPTSESTSQVILALTALSRDPLTEEGFADGEVNCLDGLLKYQLKSGGFSHTEGEAFNEMADSQAMEAMVCLEERALAEAEAGEVKTESFAGESAAATEGGSAEKAETETDQRTSEAADIKAAEVKPEIVSPENEETGAETASAESEEAGPAISALSGGTIETEAAEAANLSGTGGASVSIAGTTISVKSLLFAGILLVYAVYMLLVGKKNLKKAGAASLLAVILLLALTQIRIQSAEDYKNETYSAGEETVTVTLEIRCDTVSGKTPEKTDRDVSPVLPEDGVILAKTTCQMAAGSTVSDLLEEACRQQGIQLDQEKSGAGAHGNAYVRGIAYLYEMDYGDLSGWMYAVNDEFPGIGCGQYTLTDGDEVLWQYTCELGKDIGNEY